MVHPTKQIFQFLSTNGDGSGDTAVIGNYSVTADHFYIQPAAGSAYFLERMLVFVEDAGSFDATSYGNGITLTNGITLDIKQGGPAGAVIRTITPSAIKVNSDWGRYCYDVDVKTWGVGNEILVSRWTFSKGGSPIVLQGELNQALVLTANDDFSGLVDQTFHVQGIST